jgi:hypothetical protein
MDGITGNRIRGKRDKGEEGRVIQRTHQDAGSFIYL